jgi:hypothetical protein
MLLEVHRIVKNLFVITSPTSKAWDCLVTTYASLEHWSTVTRPHSPISQKAVIFILLTDCNNCDLKYLFFSGSRLLFVGPQNFLKTLHKYLCLSHAPFLKFTLPKSLMLSGYIKGNYVVITYSTVIWFFQCYVDSFRNAIWCDTDWWRAPH